MRLLVAVFLIASGAAVAAVGLRETATKSADAEPQLFFASLPAPSPPVPISAVVTVLAKAPIEEPVASMTTASAPTAGPALVSAVQHELTRVGCYDGAINGTWTASTRKAMGAFIERANAKLPIDKADPVLLALVQHHAGLACGSCPAGEETSVEGRCLPKAIVARATIREAAPTSTKAPSPPASVEKPLVAEADAAQPRKTARRAHRGPPIEGRMSMGAGAVAAVRPAHQGARLAGAEANPSRPVAAQPRQERRAARHANRHVASVRSRGYLRPMRPTRYAYRPFGQPSGLVSLFFGRF